MEATGALHWAK